MVDVILKLIPLVCWLIHRSSGHGESVFYAKIVNTMENSLKWLSFEVPSLRALPELAAGIDNIFPIYFH